MRLLDRHLLRELLIPLVYCLGGFFLLWTIFDLLGKMDFYRELNLSFGDVVLYYLIRTPELMVTVIPVALLLAVLYALTNLARHQELTAMRAAGISLWRLSLPYLLVGLFLTGLLFVISEYWAPRSLDVANEVLARGGKWVTRARNARWVRNLAFFNEAERRIWNIGLYDRKTGTMWAPNVVWDEPNGARRRIVAAQAVYTNRVWVFLNARQLRVSPPPNADYQRGETNRLVVPELTETPEQIDSEIVFSHLSNMDAAERPQLSLRQILNYQRLHPRLSGPDRAKLATQLHARLAEPWTCLVVVLIALPFSMASGRRNVFVGVAASNFIPAAYNILSRLSLALGTGGYLPAWLAAWLPNVTFAATGILLLRRVR
jgi:lipopolysaccharide export system permease protein